MNSNVPLISSENRIEEFQQLADAVTIRMCADPVADLARDALSDSLEAVRKSLKLAALCWKEDAEHVHHLRVSGRRALAATRLFSDVIPSSSAKWFKKKLKAILDAARQARDLDVLMHEQLPKCGRAAKKLGPVWRKQRKANQKPIVQLYKKMQKKDCLDHQIRFLLSDLETSSIAGDAMHRQSCDDWAKSRVMDISHQFFAAIPGEPSVQSLHGLRILTKRFRYMCDLLLPVLGGGRISEVVATLAELQKQLGSLQDHVVARDHFQRSLRHLNKPRHRKIVHRLMDEVDEKITERASLFRLQSDSDACQPLQSSIDAVLSLVAAVEGAPEKSAPIRTHFP